MRISDEFRRVLFRSAQLPPSQTSLTIRQSNVHDDWQEHVPAPPSAGECIALLPCHRRSHETDASTGRFRCHPRGGGCPIPVAEIPDPARSEEHTSELQSLMRISYAVFYLKKKTNKNPS